MAGSMLSQRVVELAQRIGADLKTLHKRVDGPLLTNEKCSLPAAINELLAAMPTGGSASSPDNTIAVTAGEILSGDRAVYVSLADGKAYYADQGIAACRLLCGITTGAAMLGAPATIQFQGVIANASWAWSGVSPVYLGASGLLTQTPPTSGYLIQVGTPVGAAKLRIEPQFVALI